MSLRTQGWHILEGLYDEAALVELRDTLDALHARFGAPPLHAKEPVWLAEGVEIAGPGLAFYSLLGLAPELGPRLFTDAAVDALREVLGDAMHLELVGAVLSDEGRAFTEWESHLGGIDDERWRRAGKRPRQDAIRRVVHFLFLEDMGPETGPWRVLPRAVGGPVDPPASIHQPEWPGQVELSLRAGTVLLLEESVWHCVIPRLRPGRRRFVGAYFASEHAAPTEGHDPSLDALETDDALLASVLARRPRRS
ncbi:MAG: hypothetical protein RLP09_50155 [Sandaracinaceae bacterium]